MEAEVFTAKVSSNTKAVDFQEISKQEGSTFSVDKNFGIAQINWNGKVTIHTAKKLLRLLFEAIDSHGYKKLVLDHSTLVVFETEARVWVKELLKRKAESVKDKLTDLASISPNTAIGSVYSSFAGDILKEEMPHLKMKRFDSAKDAINWLA